MKEIVTVTMIVKEVWCVATTTATVKVDSGIQKMTAAPGGVLQTLLVRLERELVNQMMIVNSVIIISVNQECVMETRCLQNKDSETRLISAALIAAVWGKISWNLSLVWRLSPGDVTAPASVSMVRRDATSTLTAGLDSTVTWLLGRDRGSVMTSTSVCQARMIL